MISKMSTPNKQHVPLILDGTFFSINEHDQTGNVIAQCETCGFPIKGSFKATSNFITHLKVKHPEKHHEFREYKGTVTPAKKQKRLPFPVIGTTSTLQNKADDNLLDFIIHTMQPLSVVMNSYFKKYSTGINSSITVPTRSTVLLRLLDRFEKRKLMLVEQLKDVDAVAVTTDIWSSHRKSYIGATCHWINTEDDQFTRKSAVLALKRFEGRHTAERIADVLREIFAYFKINGKITMVVTDNGSNFVKAFREYGCRIQYQPPKNISKTVSGEATDTEGEDEDQNEEASDEEIDQEDATDALEETRFLTSLPPHSRCASHTISLVATTDLEKELEKSVPRQDKSKSTYKQLMRSTMGKCSAYWNKCSRSVLVPESIKAEISTMPVTPCKTRWNSTYDSVKQLVENFDKLDRVFQICNVSVLQASEKEFLRAYYEGLTPVAWALDKLQAEKNLYFGSICPAIHKCHSKLTANVGKESSPVSFIASSLIIGLQRRFSGILEVNLTEAFVEIIAAVSLPLSKLWWVPDDKKEAVQAAFIEEAKKYSGDPIEIENKGVANCADDDDDLFDFNIPVPDRNSENAELECRRYLKDPDRTLTSLKNYPRIRKIFLKFNTPLPSSAPSERLFSYGKMIQTPQRARLGDDLFECLVFLKLNP